MNPFYTLVADRAAHRCEYCHDPELVFNFPFEVEHIIPVYRGESNDRLLRDEQSSTSNGATAMDSFRFVSLRLWIS